MDGIGARDDDENDWQQCALEGMFSALDSGRRPSAATTRNVAVERYLSGERLERERELVFRRLPLVVATSSDLAQPGDFVTHDHAGVPLLITRQADGRLRAFLNVCRHRGARLVAAARGHERSLFTCRYHGWGYEPDGRLRAVPFPEAFPDLDRCSRGLVELPVAERQGLIFARLSPLPLDIDAFLGSVGGELSAFGLASREPVLAQLKPVAANWQLFVETMLEAYHIPALHRRTAASALAANWGFFEPLQQQGAHGRLAIPLCDAARPDAGDDDEWQLLHHALAIYWIFPNTFLFLLGKFVHLLSVFPSDSAHSIVSSVALRSQGSDHSVFQSLYDSYWATIDEDIAIVESVQSALKSGANRDFLIGRYEGHIHERFHVPLDAVLAGKLQL